MTARQGRPRPRQVARAGATRLPRPYLYCPTGVGHPDYRFIRDRLIEVGYSGWMSFEPEGGFDSKWDQSIKTLAGIIAEIK